MVSPTVSALTAPNSSSTDSTNVEMVVCWVSVVDVAEMAVPVLVNDASEPEEVVPDLVRDGSESEIESVEEPSSWSCSSSL